MEKKLSFIMSGIIGVFLQLFILVFIIYWIITNFDDLKNADLFSIFILVVSIFLFFSMFGGYIINNINEAHIITFMGKYKGTIKDNGLFFKHPFYGTKRISLAIINHTTATIEVNEKTGVPIQISAVVSYKVVDSYKYTYETLEGYIYNQFNAALREFAKSHTYQQLSELDHNFINVLNQSVEKAGVIVIDARILQLNYVESIAASMLQKQQAQSMSDAKQTIVDNALLIAKSAAEKANFTDLEMKQKFTADLILILCSHSPVTPTMNVGSN